MGVPHRTEPTTRTVREARVGAVADVIRAFCIPMVESIRAMEG